MKSKSRLAPWIFAAIFGFTAVTLTGQAFPGTFTPTGNMSTARVGHTGTLLSNGKVLVTGGGNYSGTLASAEIYDPATGTFTATGSMTIGRVWHTATLLNDGRVLIAGGNPPGNNFGQHSAELYDPVTAPSLPPAA